MIKKMTMLLIVGFFIFSFFVPKQLVAAEDDYIHYVITGEYPPNL